MGTDAVTIRTAGGDDLTAVIDVGHRTWPATYGPIAGDDYVAMGLGKWWTQEATIPAIRAGRVSVAEVDGEVVGMASVGASDGQLTVWKLYVVPEQQGKGIGGALLRSVIAKAIEDGHARIRLSYLVGNDNAAGFYTRFGFTEAGREQAGSGIPDSVWMHLDLDPAERDQ